MNNSTAEHLTAVPTYENWNGKWYLGVWMSSLYVDLTRPYPVFPLSPYKLTQSAIELASASWVSLSNAVVVRDETRVRVWSTWLAMDWCICVNLLTRVASVRLALKYSNNGGAARTWCRLGDHHLYTTIGPAFWICGNSASLLYLREIQTSLELS